MSRDAAWFIGLGFGWLCGFMTAWAHWSGRKAKRIDDYMREELRKKWLNEHPFTAHRPPEMNSVVLEYGEGDGLRGILALTLDECIDQALRDKPKRDARGRFVKK